MTMLRATHAGRRRTISDPLTMALIPPPDESPIEREQRLRAEQDARKHSDNIDTMLRQERVDKRRIRQQEINVLLLGQSESGKSTTLKRKSQSTSAATHGQEAALLRDDISAGKLGRGTCRRLFRRRRPIDLAAP
jgi:hypothetical protein